MQRKYAIVLSVVAIVALMGTLIAAVPNAPKPKLEWLILGNTGTNPADNFLGTTDNNPLIIKTNGQQRLRGPIWSPG